MTKIFYLLFFCIFFSNICTAQQCNALGINGAVTSGAFRAPNSRFMSGRLAYIVTPAEMVAAGVANGQQITGIGWVNTIAPGIIATGNLTLYFQNTNDAVYTKSTDWATAISGMTTVHNGPLTIPNALQCNLTSFTGGSAFTYTGNALYVAFEWTYCSGPLSTAQSVSCLSSPVGGANGSSSLQSLVSCTPGTTLISSAFRPTTRFFFDCHANDIRVTTLYSMGKLALGHSNSHTVSAYISNPGTDPVNNIPVTLTVSGVNTFSNTQTIASLAAGQGTLVTFSSYALVNTGSNNVTVSVPPDDVNTNNSKSITQVISTTEIGIKSTSETSTSGAGFTGTTGVVASRFNTATGGTLKAVRLGFNTANGSTYRVAVYGDNNGIPSNTALYTDTANRTVTAIGDTLLVLNYALALPAGNFYIAVQQLSTINMTLRYVAESPLRPGQIFANSVDLGSGWSDNSPALTFRYDIDAVFYNYAITSSAGANGTISPAGVTGVNTNGSQSYTITPAACFSIEDVLVDGLSVGAVNNYNFTNITGNHTISASFIPQAPLVAPVITGPTNICAFAGTNTNVTYTASAVNATSYTWVVPPNVNIISGQGTANLVVTFNSNFVSQANRQIRVTAGSACGPASPLSIYYLNAQVPGTTGSISASSNAICPVIGTNVPVTYTIPAVANATGYTWLAQLGTTNIVHPNGAGANDTVITVTFTSGFTTSAVTVQAVNGCGTGAIRSYTISRNSPAAPSIISGPTNVCENIGPSGVAAVYTVNATAGNTYNWVVPAGATNVSGLGTNSISFLYPAGFTTGSLSVTATNGCGTSTPRTLNVSRLTPGTPGAIDVLQTMVCPGRTFSYSISPTPQHTTDIQWTVPAGATLVSGQGTAGITVSYPDVPVNGTVTVTATSNCGASPTRSLQVNLPACQPPTPRFSKVNAGRNNPVKETSVKNTITISPNPSTGSFNLYVNSKPGQPVRMKLMDASGKQIKEIENRYNQTINFGNDLKPGIYFLEVEQNGKQKTERIIKL